MSSVRGHNYHSDGGGIDPIDRIWGERGSVGVREEVWGEGGSVGVREEGRVAAACV